MNKALRLILLVFSTISLSQTQAQKYSNEFLNIGVGARAQALGNSVIANINDVTASAWNPAGLAGLAPEQGLQIGAMHSEWFAGVGKFDYLGFTAPLANKDRRIGISLIRFGIDEIPNTLSLYEDDGTINFDNLREFSAADYALLLSYAQPVKTQSGKLLIGGNVKVIYRNIGPFATAWGFGLDLGVQYKKGNWQLAAVAKDITSTFNAWSFNFTEKEKEVLQLTNNEVPISSVEVTKPQLTLGVARRFQLNKVGLTPELDFIVTTDGERNTLISSNPFSIDPALGLEADYNNFLYLRAGVNQFQRLLEFDGKETLTARPAFGVGIVIAGLHVDYAFTDPGDSQNLYSHVISLLLNVKAKKRE